MYSFGLCNVNLDTLKSTHFLLKRCPMNINLNFSLFWGDFWGGFERKLQKKVHNGSENSENKKKYGVAEKLAKKCHDLVPNGIVHNSG